jgi:hypothetical protein
MPVYGRVLHGYQAAAVKIHQFYEKLKELSLFMNKWAILRERYLTDNQYLGKMECL